MKHRNNLFGTRAISSRQRLMIPFMVMAFMLMSGLTACSDDSSSSDDNNGRQETAVSPDDYQTVTTAGGTISKGDIEFTFPAGSFSKDEKVAITEVKEGDVLGSEEASKFYQLTVSPQINKPLTIRIKCAESGADVNVVAHAPSYSLSEDILTYDDIILPSEYSEGTYTVTLPATNNKDVNDDETMAVSFGVAKVEYCGDRDPAKTRATRASNYDEKFTEGNVSWHFNLSSSFKKTYATKLSNYWSDINGCIRDAIKTLQDLGLEVTERDVTFSFAKIKEYGCFNQSGVYNEWSSIQVGLQVLENYEKDKDNFRSTIIHELMHMFQADYDPRCAFRKADKFGTISEWTGGLISEGLVVHDGSERLLLYESGAVWAEQFMIGKFNTDFANRYVDDYIKGLYAIDQIYTSGTTHSRYESHGYGMSVLMQYITRHMTEYKLNDKSIVDLYKIWHDINGSAKYCIQQLTKNAGRDLFALDYDKFLLTLLKGEIDKDITIMTMNRQVKEKNINDKNLADQHSGTCYPYGCQVNRFKVVIPDEYPLEKSQLVIEQLENGISTYAIIPMGASQDRKIDEYGYKALKGSPTIIDGAELKQKYYKPETKNTDFMLYTVSSNMYNSKNLPYKVRVEIKPVSGEKKDVVSLSIDGSLSLKCTSLRLDGEVIDYNDKFNPTALLQANDKNTTFVATLNGSTLHVEATQKLTTEKTEYGNKKNINATYHIGFDIENFVATYDYCSLKNLKMSVDDEEKATSNSGVTTMKKNWSMNATNVLLDPDQVTYSPNSNFSLRFYATVKDGLKVTSYDSNAEFEYELNPGWTITQTSSKNTKCSYSGKSTDDLDIKVEFKP